MGAISSCKMWVPGQSVLTVTVRRREEHGKVTVKNGGLETDAFGCFFLLFLARVCNGRQQAARGGGGFGCRLLDTKRCMADVLIARFPLHTPT